MSAPQAGKFQDHYVVLGIDPKADAETIHQTYLTLAADYRPEARNANKEKYEAVTLAYEVLSDPAARAMFDSLRGAASQKEALPEFTGFEFFDSLSGAQQRRLCVLCLLYDRRRFKPVNGNLSQRHMEAMVAMESLELQLALYYLKQRGYVILDDKSNLQITVDGMEYLESHIPPPEAILPLLKPAAVAEASRAACERPASARAIAGPPPVAPPVAAVPVAVPAAQPAQPAAEKPQLAVVPPAAPDPDPIATPEPASDTAALADADEALHDAIKLLTLAGNIEESQAQRRTQRRAVSVPSRMIASEPRHAPPVQAEADPELVAVALPQPKANPEPPPRQAPIARTPKLEPRRADEPRKAESAKDDPPKRLAITK